MPTLKRFWKRMQIFLQGFSQIKGDISKILYNIYLRQGEKIMEKNYSIIIPHKNIPDLLKRCLDSIPRRNDVQIIVVDDNSDPEKVDFSNFPGVGEKCVEVYFTKEGKGAGFARNVGLKYAIGKWVLFADADDPVTRACTAAERYVSRELGGSCQVPLAAYATVSGSEMRLRALVGDHTTGESVSTEVIGQIDDWQALARRAVEHLLQQGAKRYIDKLLCDQ